jgi:hypothetical protein
VGRIKCGTMRDVDKALMQEVADGTANEARIRQLISLGANVNAVGDGESVLTKAVFGIVLGGDRKIVDLLIELGADPTYVGDEGESALWDACLLGDADLVSFLLEKGADPNIIGERGESLLDAVECDQFFSGSGNFDDWACSNDSESDPYSGGNQIVRNLDAVISLLKEHGAKPLAEMKADVVSRWLVVFASNPTGLLTFGGHIQVDALPGITKALVHDFKKWKAEFWDSWPHRDWASMPKTFDRAKHNDWGRRLAGAIRSIIPMEIEVEYVTVDAKDELERIRNVNREIIGTEVQ